MQMKPSSVTKMMASGGGIGLSSTEREKEIRKLKMMKVWFDVADDN